MVSMKPTRGTAVKAAEHSGGEFPRELKTMKASALEVASKLLRR